MSTPDIGSNTEPENTSDGTSTSQTSGDTIQPNKSLLLAIASGLSLFLLLASWAWIVPPKSAPDDDFHLTTTWCAWGDSPYCIQEPGGTVRVPQQLVGLNCRNFDFTVADATCDWDPPFTYEPTDRILSSNFYNWPLFYVVNRAFVGESISESTLRMRLFNAATFSFLFGLAMYVSSAYVRRGLALAWIVAISPMAAFTIVSTTPQSWALIGGSLAWVFFTALMTVPTAQRMKLAMAAVGTLSTLILAASARSDAALYVGASFFASLILITKPGDKLPRRSLPILVALGALILVGFAPRGWSMLGGVIRQSQTSLDNSDAPVALAMLADLPAFFAGGTGFFPASNVPWNGLVSFGLGWEGFPSPSFAYLPLLMATGALILWGMRRVSHSRLWAVALMTILLVVIPIATVWSFDFQSGVQVRYFLPFIVTILAFVFMSEKDPTTFLTRGQMIAIGALTTIGSGIAFVSTLVRYRFGLSDLWDVQWARIWVAPMQETTGNTGLAAIVGLTLTALVMIVLIFQVAVSQRALFKEEAEIRTRLSAG